MCRLYGTRRHSLRRASAALEAEGKLRVEHGRGTFVERAPLVNSVIGQRTRFREISPVAGADGEGAGYIRGALIPADTRIAKALDLRPVGALVHAISPAWLANDLPIEPRAGLSRCLALPRFGREAAAGHLGHRRSIARTASRIISASAPPCHPSCR